jgi:hypothetical protein
VFLVSHSRRRFLIGMGAAALSRADSDLLRQSWSARWIAPAGAPAHEYCVCLFRRAIELDRKPERFIIHISGDNRYRLFLNGREASCGPARSDLFHWHYETIDAAPFLNAGSNILAAEVWNFGELAPLAQMTLQTGFLLQGDSEAERIIDTGAKWKALVNPAHSPIEFTHGQMHGYYVAGPGDRVRAAAYPWGWQNPKFDDSAWRPAVALEQAAGRDASDPHSRWMLTPRTIPAMEQRPEQPMKIRRGGSGFPLHIAAGAHASILLDQSYLTTGFPELAVSGGKGAVIRMRYAESLFHPIGRPGPNQKLEKGNRDEIEGKIFIGYHDEFIPDGVAARIFRPLWWRTWRYIELDIQAKSEPLTIDSLRATYTGFPFQRRARFDARRPDLDRLLDVGWRTARLCAHETYMDCPYYEQLQYVGDTRIQCLVSLFMTGDPRLMRNAIEQLDQSRQSDGCTMSRYPTRLEQYIPAFALWWIGIVRDYWWYVDDPAFARRMLPGVRAVLEFFDGFAKENGSLGPLPWWRYFDWVPEWKGGDAPQEPDGGSAMFDLLLLMAWHWAAELEESVGMRALAEFDRARESRLRDTAQALYWDSDRRLYADTPRKSTFSPHTNTLAVLSGLTGGAEGREILLRALADDTLPKPGLFFRFYVHQALALVGEGDSYLDRLADWHDMLAKGLTTFAEIVDRPGNPSRSDCHAWSASPNIELMRTVLGVDSAAPGFRKVSVRPHPGKLEFLSGAVPHPKGEIVVRLEPSAATVTLPPGIIGEFELHGVKSLLASGENRINL